MGTSLSGLTPATTFDGLLKTSDNDPIGAALKTIGTGDGTDSVLQLSDSALQIGGTFNVDGGIATFKGVGSSSLTSSFIIKNSEDEEIFRIRDDAQIFATYINGQSVSASTYALYGAAYAPNIRVNIKGSGATSATTSLLVQNSAGSELFKVQDDGLIQAQNLKIDASSTLPLLYAENNTNKSLQLGNQAHLSAFSRIDFKTFDGSAYSEVMRITGNTAEPKVGIGETTPTARLHLKGSGNDNTTTSLLVQNSDGTDLLKVNDQGQIYASGNAVTIGDGTGTPLRLLVDTNNNYIQPLGTPANQRVVVTGNSVNTIKAVDLDVSNVYIGYGINQTAATGTLSIKGSGATAATTALLVQNSAGTELFRIKDNYTTQITTDGSSDPALYLNTGVGRENASGGLSIGSTTSTFNINSRYGSGVINASSNLFLTSSVGIGGNYASASGGSDASAILAVSSTTQGFLPPRMTQAQRDAITTPAAGLMIYNTDTNTAECWNGSAWMPMF